MIDGLRPYPETKPGGLPWLGDVPAHWEVRRNGRLFAARRETGFPDLPILEVSIRSGVRIRDFDNGGRKQEMADRSKYQRAERGDIAYNMMRMWQGAVGIAPTDGLVSPAYVVARPFPETDAAYYAYLFRTATYMRETDVFSRGIVPDRNRLYWESFKQMPSVYPPLDEQRLIVRLLDWHGVQTAKLIRAKKKLIALLNEQKQAIIHRAVTRGVNPNVKLIPSGISWLGELPEHWEVVPLKFLCRRIQNGATPPTSEQHYFQNGAVPWFGPSSFISSDALGSPVRYLTRSAFEAGAARLINGPAIVIIVIGATAGRMSLLVGEGATNQQITAFELRQDKILPQFGLLQLRNSEVWLKSTASTATIPILDSSLVNRLPVAFPRLGEQEVILSAVSNQTRAIATSVSRFERETDLIREYRARLIADVVTGKLDVRVLAASLPEVTDVEPIDELINGGSLDETIDDFESEEVAA